MKDKLERYKPSDERRKQRLKEKLEKSWYKPTTSDSSSIGITIKTEIDNE